MKKNCWEFKNCGKTPAGKNGVKSVECPAITESQLNGIHGGKNAGRACWIVAGTFSEGDIQCAYAKEHKSCFTCDFYISVRNDEAWAFVPSIILQTYLLKKTK